MYALHVFIQMHVISNVFFAKYLSAPFENQRSLVNKLISTSHNVTKRETRDLHCGESELYKGRPNNYVLMSGRKWKKDILKYKIVNYSSLGMLDTQKILLKAFSIWQEVSTLRFEETNDLNADIKITFPRYHERICHYPFGSYTLAHAFTFNWGSMLGDIHFNTDYQWTKDFLPDSSRTVELLPVAVHEIGHVLGLNHSSDKNSLMYAVFNMYKSFDGRLSQDDIHGIQDLYGLPSKTKESEFGLSVLKADFSEICATNVDSISIIRNELFVFKGKTFWRTNKKRENSESHSTEFWSPLPFDLTKIDAVYERADSDWGIIFIIGLNFYHLSSSQTLESQGQISLLGLPSNVKHIDSAFTYKSDIYFFSGHQYWRINQKFGKFDESIYPRKIGTDFKDIPNNIDAAYYDQLGSVHIFKDNRVYKFNMTSKLVDSVYNWPECTKKSFDSKFVASQEQVNAAAVPIETIIAIVVALSMFLIAVIILLFAYRRKLLCKQDQMIHLKDQMKQNNVQSGEKQLLANVIAQCNPDYGLLSGTDILSSVVELNQIPRYCLMLIRFLGKGAFGEVYEGTLSNSVGKVSVAVKTVSKSSNEDARTDFYLEALIMRKFNHPNIVKLIGVCFDTMPYFIVVELLAGGDLNSFLRELRQKENTKTNMKMLNMLQIALDVAEGCKYLEDNHFIHCDIATRNCLLTTKGDNRIVKIADFGKSRDIYRAGYYRKIGKALIPVRWMPPEALLDFIFTSKTDVWSFGILLWEIFTFGCVPYAGLGNQGVIQLVVNAAGRLKSPTGCPIQIYQIMSQCWHVIPERRPNFSTIKNLLISCIQEPLITSLPISDLSQTFREYSLMEDSISIKDTTSVSAKNRSTNAMIPTSGYLIPNRMMNH